MASPVAGGAAKIWRGNFDSDLTDGTIWNIWNIEVQKERFTMFQHVSTKNRILQHWNLDNWDFTTELILADMWAFGHKDTN